MKTTLRTMLIAVPALALAGGCATGGGMASQATPDSQSRHVTDAKYMAIVERKALSRGVEVHWVHPPTRRVAASDE